jgi:hypothetical protein
MTVITETEDRYTVFDVRDGRIIKRGLSLDEVKPILINLPINRELTREFRSVGSDLTLFKVEIVPWIAFMRDEDFEHVEQMATKQGWDVATRVLNPKWMRLR